MLCLLSGAPSCPSCVAKMRRPDMHTQFRLSAQNLADLGQCDGFPAQLKAKYGALPTQKALLERRLRGGPKAKAALQ